MKDCIGLDNLYAVLIPLFLALGGKTILCGNACLSL